MQVFTVGDHVIKSRTPLSAFCFHFHFEWNVYVTNADVMPYTQRSRDTWLGFEQNNSVLPYWSVVRGD